MRSETRENVLQVVGKASESTRELMDGLGKDGEGEIGKE
jgi:hypothetical protein